MAAELHFAHKDRNSLSLPGVTNESATAHCRLPKNLINLITPKLLVRRHMETQAAKRVPAMV